MWDMYLANTLHGTPIWDTYVTNRCMEHVYGTCIFDMYLTNILYLTPIWNMYVTNTYMEHAWGYAFGKYIIWDTYMGHVL